MENSRLSNSCVAKLYAADNRAVGLEVMDNCHNSATSATTTHSCINQIR